MSRLCQYHACFACPADWCACVTACPVLSRSTRSSWPRMAIGDIESGRATQEDGEDGANIVEGVTSSGRVMRFRDMGTEWFRRVASNM